MRSRWGDAVYSTVYLWVRAAIVFGVPAALAAATGVLLIRSGVVFLGGALFAAGVSGLALTYMLGYAARAVLTVVLYRYGESGKVYPAFPAELLDHSVRGPSGFVRRLTQRIDGDRVRRLRRRILGDPADPA